MESRTYLVENQKMKFSSTSFKIILEAYCKTHKTTKKNAEHALADKLRWDKETVHKWQYGMSNPNDLKTVKDLAEALEISDFKRLLESADGGKGMDKLTERQITAVKKIYDSCIWFLNEFNNSDGFNDYWYKFVRQGIENPENDITELANSLHERVGLVIDQEFFDLRGTEIYNELSEFISDDLVDIYYGKVSYAYRFEAVPKGHPTTDEDYGNAMLKLNQIIEKYV